MEMIVVFNAGRDAHKAGDKRIPPAQIPYPDAGTVALSDYGKREWLRGYDRQAVLTASLVEPA